jgi:predicted transposase YbfD/YdcC
MSPEPKTLLEAIRAHCGIENTLHWSLDVTFGEDKSRLRKHNAATNMAVIRKAAFNALKRDLSEISLKLKRVMAAHNHTFRSS